MQYPGFHKQALKLLNKVKGYWKDIPENYIATDEIGNQLGSRLADCLSLPVSNVVFSVKPLIGYSLGRSVVYDLCYHLVANKDLLQSEVVSFRSTVPYGGIIETRITDIAREESQKYCVTLQILTGPSSRCYLYRRLYIGELERWKRKLGYKDSLSVDNPRGYITPERCGCLLGLFAKFQSQVTVHTRMWVDAELSLQDSSDVVTYNRRYILAYRKGMKDCPCHRDNFRDSMLDIGDEPDIYCSMLCPESWDTCSASGHAIGYTHGDCKVCGGKSVYFDTRRECSCADCYYKSNKLKGTNDD